MRAWKQYLDLPVWEEVDKRISQLNAAYLEVVSGKKITKKTIQAFTDSKDILSWILYARNDFPEGLWDSYRDMILELKESLGDRGQTTPTILRFKESLEKYYVEPSPTSFTWNNIKIKLPEGSLPETLVSRVLNRLSESFSLLEKRGLTKLALDTLKEIQILPNIMSQDGIGKSGGIYWVNKDTIGLNALFDDTQKLSDTFIHELGHHIHISVLPREAREFWNSGWSLYDFKVESLTRDLTISKEDLLKWMSDLHPNYDIAGYGNTLKGAEKVRYNALFYEHYFLKSPKTMRNDFWGLAVRRIKDLPPNLFPFLRHWRGTYDQLRRVLEKDHNISEESLINAAFGYRKLQEVANNPNSSELDNLKREVISANYKELNQILVRLGIPTEYGHTNVFEDFAETFKEYVLNPSSLSEEAKWRLLRTLGMSGSLGTDVMRKASI